MAWVCYQSTTNTKSVAKNFTPSRILYHLKTIISRTPVIVSPGQGGEGEEDGGEDEEENGKYEGRPGVARPLNKGKQPL